MSDKQTLSSLEITLNGNFWAKSAAIAAVKQNGKSETLKISAQSIFSTLLLVMLTAPTSCLSRTCLANS